MPNQALLHDRKTYICTGARTSILEIEAAPRRWSYLSAGSSEAESLTSRWLLDLTTMALYGKPHTPLDHAKKQIRLLSFRTDSTFDLKVFDLDDCPGYFALSYAWGSPEDGTSTIMLKGEWFQVRQNLHSALAAISHQVRSPVSWPWDHYTHFWIDAICIDQNNVDERNHQVRLMADIYGRAHCVLV